jgi:hypothetical protein
MGDVDSEGEVRWLWIVGKVQAIVFFAFLVVAT